MQTEKSGVLWGIGAYCIWGFMPVYWKNLEHVASMEILLSRISWAFIFTILLVLLVKDGRHLMGDLKTLWRSQKDFWTLFLASVFISGNWFIYIWAVNHNHIVQTSLGYYINPLISVSLGIIFLKERLSRSQQAAFLSATIGVLILTISYGDFPWVALGLAVTFAVYSLIKKQIQLDALRGLTIETMFVVPIAVVMYIWMFKEGNAAFLHVDLKTNILLIFTGIATALPLIMFAKGAQRMPLYMIGFLQYISPTTMLILGVLIYGETFGNIELLSFSFIWLALLLFAGSTFWELWRMKKSLQ